MSRHTEQVSRGFNYMKGRNEKGQFVKGYTYKHTEESKKRLSISKLGDKNPNWKGDDVGYNALHLWFTRNFKKPKLCQKCKKKPSYDLANISGEYKRDFGDWEWLCRRCHMIKDGRLDKFAKLAKAKSNRVIKMCEFCEKEFSSKPSAKRKFCSQKCYFNKIRIKKGGDSN